MNMHTGLPDKRTKRASVACRVLFCRLVLSGMNHVEAMRKAYPGKNCNRGHLAQIMKNDFVKLTLSRDK